MQTTPLGFGGSTVGNLDPDRQIPEGDALAAIEAAWEAGIRYFDTAPLYGAGVGERRMGEILRRYPRRSYVLSTKIGVLVEPPEAGTADGSPFTTVYDYGYDATLRSLEDSMGRTGIDRFDIVFIHDIDVYNHGVEGQKRRFREAMDGAYPALDRLRGEGAVGAIGVGVNSWQVCRQCAEAADFDCFLLAGRYTLLEQESLDPFLGLCAERRIGVIAGAPFNTGILAHGAVPGATYNHTAPPPDILLRTRRIEQVCARHGVSLAAAALRFPLGHPVVAAVLCGPRNAAQVGRSVQAFNETIPAGLWRDLKDEGLIDARAPSPE